MKKVEIEIFTLEERKPNHDERVMVWSEEFYEWRPQVYNAMEECWDTEDGDDFDKNLDKYDRWFCLPER